MALAGRAPVPGLGGREVHFPREALAAAVAHPRLSLGVAGARRALDPGPRGADVARAVDARRQLKSEGPLRPGIAGLGRLLEQCEAAGPVLWHARAVDGQQREIGERPRIARLGGVGETRRGGGMLLQLVVGEQQPQLKCRLGAAALRRPAIQLRRGPEVPRHAHPIAVQRSQVIQRRDAAALGGGAQQFRRGGIVLIDADALGMQRGEHDQRLRARLGVRGRAPARRLAGIVRHAAAVEVQVGESRRGARVAGLGLLAQQRRGLHAVVARPLEQ